MTPIAIQLRPSMSPPSRADAGAVFISGADVSVWLAEAASWPDIISASTRMFVLPTSATDMRPAGVLLLPQPGSLVTATSRAMPCEELHPRVWVPRGATLLPALTREEVARLFFYHVHFIHPALGVIGWDEGDAVDPHQLMSVPPNRRGASWEMASTGPEVAPTLQSVMLQIDEGALDFLAEAGAGIGDKSHQDFVEGRGISDKMGDALGGAITLGLGLVGGAVQGLGGLFGAGPNQGNHSTNQGKSGAGKPGMLDFLMEWAKQQTEAREERRHKELERLMKLLETNPELGLHYAIPLAGSQNARGFAQKAGDHLTFRTPSLRNLGGGGGVVDPWNLNNEWNWKLNQRYRELAAEEIRRGNFQRAAYIYGELLGEWALAADALVQGGLHREAARLHLLKTKNQAQAAQCLEKGGLLVEAVEIYAELKMHEKCGDLWLKMGRKDDAFRCYLMAIREAPDRLQTARILRSKMNQHGWAASVLASGWPHSEEALPCLEAHFRLLNECRAEEEARIQTERLVQHANALFTSVETLRVLARIVRDLRFPALRERFIVIARLAIADAVSRSSNSKTSAEFIKLLIDFEPKDVLLKTDVRRFTTKKVELIPMPLRTRIDKPIRPTRVLEISVDMNWLAFGAHQGHWLALGKETHRNTVTLYLEDARTVTAPISLGVGNVRSAWFVEDADRNSVGVVIPNFMRWSERQVHCREKILRIHPLLTDFEWGVSNQKSSILGVSPSGSRKDQFTVLMNSVSTGTLDLLTFGFDNHCSRTRSMGIAELAPDLTSLPFATIADRAFFALGNIIYMLEDKDGVGYPRISHVNMPYPVTSLVAARLGQKIHVVACGGSVVLLSPEEKWEPVELDSGADSPALHFMPDGNLIIAHHHEAKVIRVEGRVQTIANLVYDPKPALGPHFGVVSLDVSTCAILMRDGKVQIFHIEQ